MSRYFAWLVSASLAAGGLALLSSGARAAPDDARAQRSGDKSSAEVPKASFPAGVKVKEASSADGIRDTLETATQAALTKEGFDDLCERLVDQDKDRIGKYANQKFSELDGIVDQIRKDWKAKYNQDFKVDSKAAFTKVALYQGEIQDANALAANWPVPPMARESGGAVTAGASERRQAQAPSDPNTRESKLTNGRDVAIAAFPASHGLPQINVSLVHELVRWHIDVPNNVTGPQINAALTKHLTAIKDHPDQWPGDVNDAEAMVAHHVMMALYNLDVPQRSAK